MGLICTETHLISASGMYVWMNSCRAPWMILWRSIAFCCGATQEMQSYIREQDRGDSLQPKISDADSCHPRKKLGKITP